MVVIKSSAYLKIPSLLSTSIIIISLLIFWFKNVFEIGLENLSNVKAFNWEYSLPLVSSQVYSIESIGTLLTIRQAMKRPFDMKRVIHWVFLLSLCLFILNGWSFYSSFTERKEIAFFYYSNDNMLVTILQFGFYLTLPATMIITLFALMAVVDSFGCVKGALQSEDNQTQSLVSSSNSGNLFGDNDQEQPSPAKGNYCLASLYRLLLGILLLSPLLFEIDEYFLILFTGSLISPCLGFIFPIVGYNYYFREQLKEKPLKKVLNYSVLILGIVVNAASFVYTLKNKD
jgi:amino acid permease